ncbi:MAG: hypothetical protein K2W96_27905 [Gemmataceae bacterium]|nr:hypothetical protein [Gemmataceae bacterium]
MGALANKEVGEYVNKYFVSSFQKVATFKIVGKAKQGGNVAAYFCAPDGRVLHCVAGPVDAATFLRESKWLVETVQKAMKDSKGDGGKFKSILRTAHAEKLKADAGITVEPVTFDAPEPDPKSALTYSDPTGRPLAPKLNLPPIDGPDVTLRAAEAKSAKEDAKMGRALAPGGGFADGRGKRWGLGTQERVHVLLAGHSLAKIEKLYGTVFENILGEKISTKPVEVVTPFPWVRRGGAKAGG